MLTIAINGFGRIGRAAFKIALEKKNIRVAAINDLTDTVTLAHLLQFDTVYGRYGKSVRAIKDALVVGKEYFPVTAIKEPAELPWKERQVDVVLECTGRFLTQELSAGHLQAGSKRVILSAPAKSESIATYLRGVNDGKIKKSAKIISNASCTTNCITPVAAVMQSRFGVRKAMMTTIHAYTADQNLVDGPHKELRRARAAAQNIVPTTTGAAHATTKVIPQLKGLFDGLSVRVPVPVGSLADFTFLLKKKVTVEEVNIAMRDAAKNPLYKGVLQVTHDPVVSSDIIGNPHSSIVDLNLTKVVDGDMVKVVAWYDNEWGYANRLVEMAMVSGK